MTSIVEAVAALLLVASGLMSLIGGLGFVRLKDFFQRMHPPALASGLAAFCVLLASTLLFWTTAGRFSVHAFVIVVLLAVTVPVFVSILARAALFRNRTSGRAVPPSLTADLPGPARPPTERAGAEGLAADPDDAGSG